MDHTVGQRLKQSTICTLPGLSQHVQAPVPLPPTGLRPCLWQSILPPSLSQLWCTPRLYPWTSHSVDILYVDMTLAPPCQRHTAKLSAQLWMQNERR